MAVCESRDVGVEETEGERCGEKRRIIGERVGKGGHWGEGREGQGGGADDESVDGCYF